jgi:hypothetical protein
VSTTSKDRQVKFVLEGLAVATVAPGITGVTSGKLAMELAFGRALRS